MAKKGTGYGGQKRKRTLAIRLSEEEYAWIRQAAERGWLPPVTWARTVLLTKARVVNTIVAEQAAREAEKDH